MEAAVHYLAIASSGRDADDCAAEEVQAAEEDRRAVPVGRVRFDEQGAEARGTYHRGC